jgi:hypothetical protein
VPTRRVRAMSNRRSILLVVDPTASDSRAVSPLVQAVLARNAREVYVVAPVFTTRMAWLTNDDSEALANAEQRLSATLRELYDGHVEASGSVGGDDSIMTAIADALGQFPADEIIIAVHADNEQHWRERSIAAKIRSRHAQPLTELVVESDGTIAPEG